MSLAVDKVDFSLPEARGVPSNAMTRNPSNNGNRVSTRPLKKRSGKDRLIFNQPNATYIWGASSLVYLTRVWYHSSYEDTEV